MPKQTNENRIERKRFLNRADRDRIRALQILCEEADSIALKLELDYKLADAQCRPETDQSPDVNEFLYVRNGSLIGYLGICAFGGGNGPLELTGMVHPGHRRKGVFKALSGLALAECRRRNADAVLGLCDRKAGAGQALLKGKNFPLCHTEYEMVLRRGADAFAAPRPRGLTLRKAVNADALEIARQDQIYFGDERGEESGVKQSGRLRMPEEEEKRGFTIYLAEKDGKIIGKVNVQRSGGLGGIYGLGVLPPERGMGYGRAILLLAVQLLREAQADTICLQVLTDNEKALNLYTSCGFKINSVMDYYRLMQSMGGSQ